MSWLARSLVNSLRDDPDPAAAAAAAADGDEDDSDSDSQPATPSRGVKEDLSELTQTLTRQFWGVASFLAPPPPASASSAPDSASDSDELPSLAGIRSDLAEIGGKVRSGISSISALSSNKAVTEISKIASTLFGSDGEEEDEDGEGVEMRGVGGVGVSEEVVAFVRSVSLHPETWLDFPMLADADDFNMTDAQEEHAFAMEELAPSLAALRVQLCPGHMSEGCFWKIYFVLVHPKLNKHDAGLLSTPQDWFFQLTMNKKLYAAISLPSFGDIIQIVSPFIHFVRNHCILLAEIVQARAMLLQDLPVRRGPESVHSGVEAVEISHEELATLVPPGEKVGSPPYIPDMGRPAMGQMPSTEFETDKHTIQTTELQIIEKSVVEEESVQGKSKDIPTDTMDIPAVGYEEGDDWLEDESGEPSAPRGTNVHLGNDEDVSFSDLEADDDDDDGEGMHFNSKTKTSTVGSPKEESGWVQLDKSSEGAVRSGNSSSPDWLDVDMDTV